MEAVREDFEIQKQVDVAIDVVASTLGVDEEQESPKTECLSVVHPIIPSISGRPGDWAPTQ